MALTQLVYTSVRNENCDDAEIQKILEACQRNNPSKDITGVLLHSENRFIQYLEGPKEIIKLYDMIKGDARHSKVVMLNYGPLKERNFPAWHMGFKSLSSDKIDFLTEASERDKVTFRSIIKGEDQSDNAAAQLLVKFFKAA